MATAPFRPKNLCAGDFYGKVPAKRGSDAAIFSEVVHTAEADVPEHSHQLAYFQLVLGGSYSERFASRTIEHPAMSVIWHRPGISHKDWIGKGGGRFFCIEVRQDTFARMHDYAAISADHSQQNTRLVWLAARLFHEFKNWQECSELIAEGLTLEMLGQASFAKPNPGRTAPAWLNQVVERLNDDFASNISTDDLAATIGIHPVHLSAVFRRFRGQTVGEYLQQVRISHASRLLISRKISLAEIAVESGFSDQSHLNRTFKRYTGLTPGAFRSALG